LKRYGVAAAQAYYLGLLDDFDFLLATPFAGQIDEDSASGLRRWRYRQHKVFYQVSSDVLLIVRVLHQLADVSGQLG
jgi:plasmid stabilization system protein ParE